MYAEKGFDIDSLNYGGDVRTSITTKHQDYGNTIGQGDLRKIINLQTRLSYQLRQNLFLELKHIYRKADSSIDKNDLTTNYVLAGIRWNMAPKNWLF